MKKIRALVLAESCNPDWFSVPLVGWFHCEALHRLPGPFEAHIVTQVRNRDAFLKRGWREGIDFTAIDSELPARPLSRFDEWLRKRTGLGWTVNTALAGIPQTHFEYLTWKRFGAAI